MSKKTHYELFPNQYKFAFEIDNEARIKSDQENGRGSFMDFALYKGGFGCVPADTEYLSPTGWKPIKNLIKTSKLAVYYPDGSIKFEEPKEVFKWNADKWYNFNTRFIHQTLCPNHKIVYWSDRNSEEIKTIRCEDYVNQGCNQHYKIKNYFRTSGDLLTGLSENELRVLVAYQADGYDYKLIYKNKSTRTLGFHLKKERKIKRLISLLEKCDKNFVDKPRLNGIKKGYHDIFSTLNLARYKHFPVKWYQLNNKELSIILDEVQYWDCTHKGSSIIYSTNNKSDRDFIQFVAASQGYCTTTYERTRNIKIVQQDKEYVYKNKTEYNVSWTKGKLLSMGKPQVVEAKGGEAKYCPSTSTGMWVARCKNHIFVTGNS